jgi:hypothetical protein
MLNPFMTPQAAVDAQIEKYRAMAAEERLKLALNLHGLSCEIARDGIRHQYPKASPDEVASRSVLQPIAPLNEAEVSRRWLDHTPP